MKADDWLCGGVALPGLELSKIYIETFHRWEHASVKETTSQTNLLPT